jgi:hypothetical protein
MATLRPVAGAAVLAAALLVVVACGPSTTPGPSGSPASSSPAGSASAPPSTAGTVETPEAAAALVLAQDPRFAGIKPADPNLIGACCSWTAVPATDGAWIVTIEIGWGDCPAGCIDRHHWIYEVTHEGGVSLVGEDGPPVPAGITGAGDGGGTGIVGIRGTTAAGPVCPVVRPGDPNCADRPVAGATVHVLDSTGTEIAVLQTDANGAFQIALPRGTYRLMADPVEGLMGTPPPTDVEVGSGLSVIVLAYDTGIR